MSLDVTDRHLAEEAARESEERFLKAFHANPTAQSISTLPEGRWTEVNESFLRMLEYTREEVIGHDSHELGMIDPVERARILRLLGEKGAVRNYEVSIRTKTGKPITLLTSSEKIVLNGQEHALSIMIDITDRKRAEAEISHLASFPGSTPIQSSNSTRPAK